MDEQEDEDEMLIQVLDETIFLSSQIPPSARATLPAPSPEIPSSLQSAGQPSKIPPFTSYSPPRVLSQRVSVPNGPFLGYSNSTVVAIRPPDSPTSSDLEIDRLKVRVSCF